MRAPRPIHRKPSPTKLAAQRSADVSVAKRKASPTRKATESVRSAHGGAVAAERSRLAAKARSAAPGLAVQGFNTTGLGATGKVTGTLGGTAPPLRATLGASMAAPRGAAAGRAAAAVTARLAHIDALLAKSKAAAGGARGYGDLWPASLGKAPPAASQADEAQTAADAAPVLESVAALQDWEVEKAMQAAQWAVSHWEAPFGGASAINTPEPGPEARQSARVSSLFLAARLRMEMDETEVLGELVSMLVDDVLAGVYAILDGGDVQDEAADGEAAEAVVHQLVEEALSHVMAELEGTEQEAAQAEAEDMATLLEDVRANVGAMSVMRNAVIAKKARNEAAAAAAEAKAEAQAGRVSGGGAVPEEEMVEAAEEPRDEAAAGEGAGEAAEVTDA